MTMPEPEAAAAAATPPSEADPAAAPRHTIRALAPAEAAAWRDALVDLLVDAVEHGASVNFVLPMTRAKAEAWWDGALASHARGERLIFAAVAGEGTPTPRLDGSVQLVFAPQENQPFRADLSKMLVMKRARRRGLGEALLAAAEAAARARGRTLLTLDTEDGGDGYRLYQRLGYVPFGTVPGYALDAAGGRRLAATFFYKELAAELRDPEAPGSGA